MQQESKQQVITNDHGKFKGKKIKKSINDISTQLSAIGTLLILFLTVPAMPIMFYLTILYNVMIMVVEFFREL